MLNGLTIFRYKKYVEARLFHSNIIGGVVRIPSSIKKSYKGLGVEDAIEKHATTLKTYLDKQGNPIEVKELPA